MKKAEIIDRLDRAIDFVDEWQEDRERAQRGGLPETLECALQEIVQLRDDLKMEAQNE